MPERCTWPGTLPIYVAYHDEEWGVPVRDDRLLFQHLLLDGAQAGLSWLTILKRRENYRRAFDDFDPEKMARYGDAKVQALLQDDGIIRNRLKVQAFIANARAFLDLQEELGSFSDFLWSFVGGEPMQNAWTALSRLPAETDESRAMSKALKARGFKFVGPTICYAFMQAAGLVNDHIVSCFRYEQLRSAAGNAKSKGTGR